MYSSLGLPFFPQLVVFGPQGYKKAARDLVFYFYATVYEIYKTRAKVGVRVIRTRHVAFLASI